MELGKKDKWIIFLSICIFIFSGINIFLTIQSSIIEIRPPDLETLVVGTGSGPHDLDPTDSWDSASNDVIEQVVETLFTYDVRQYVIDQTMPRINWLATGYSWDITNTILTLTLRQNVKFHDGTEFNADAVKWNLDRFMYLMNHTGELPPDGRAVKVHSLYEFPDGTPIFDEIVVVSDFVVEIHLNAPYAPILDAMCIISCGMLSPTSTPNNRIIDLSTGDIVGTGPYMYDYYITDTEVRFTKFEDYWATQAPYNLEDEVMFDAMVYSVIDDPSTLNYAMLAGDIDVIFGAITELLPAYRTNPLITAYEAETPGLVYQYLNFNTKLINVTWRKAMSYAINYTYIIEVMLKGRAFRAYGATSPSYGAGFNHWLRDAPGPDDNGSAVYDLSVARDTLLNGMGADSRLAGLVSSDDPDDDAWEAVELNSFNYSYNTDNWFRFDLYIVLVDWFDDIGITLIDGGTDWGYFILRAWGYVPGGYDQLNMFFVMETSYRWFPTSKNPEYLDPFNRIDPLFSNISVSNACLINDPWVMGNLSLALQTIDDTARNQIYRDIEWRLFAELYVHAPVNHNMITSVHSADLYDVAYNVMGRWWALPVKRNFTWVPSF